MLHNECCKMWPSKSDFQTLIPPCEVIGGELLAPSVRRFRMEGLIPADTASHLHLIHISTGTPCEAGCEVRIACTCAHCGFWGDKTLPNLTYPALRQRRSKALSRANLCLGSLGQERHILATDSKEIAHCSFISNQ